MNKIEIQKVLEEVKNITGINLSLWNNLNNMVATFPISEKQYSQVQGFLKVPEKEEQQSYSLIKLLTPEGVYELVFHQSMVESPIKELSASRVKAELMKDNPMPSEDELIVQILLDSVTDQVRHKSKSYYESLYQVPVDMYVLECEPDTINIVRKLLKGLFDSRHKEKIIKMSENEIVVIREHPTDNVVDKETTSSNAAGEMSRMIVDSVEAELMSKISIGYSRTGFKIVDLKEVYDEAKLALEVGKTFYPEKRVLDYNSLGIGRIMHQLPVKNSEKFLEEVLKGYRIEEFGDEVMLAVYKFYENNLNISETARQLYVHRNTLVYRLGKIKKRTGLDIRAFDDAMTFKVAILLDTQVKGQ